MNSAYPHRGIKELKYYPDTDSFIITFQEADEFVSTDEVAPNILVTYGRVGEYVELTGLEIFGACDFAAALKAAAEAVSHEPAN